MTASNLALEVVQALAEKKLTLATAESCTGGLIAKLITDISGSSAVFTGGVVSYSNEMKMKWLGVQSEILSEFGAVSEQTVSQMLLGIQHETSCDLTIAVSGIAGPTGGSPDKPVGTVFIGWRNRGQTLVERFQFSGNREKIRQQAAETALKKLLELIS